MDELVWLLSAAYKARWHILKGNLAGPWYQTKCGRMVFPVETYEGEAPASILIGMCSHCEKAAGINQDF